MRVEPGRDDDQVRHEAFQPRQDAGLHRVAELLAPVARAKRRVDDIVVNATLADGAGAGKERHLMRRGIEHRRVGPENRLGAVAVMHVEIDDGDTFGAVHDLGVAGGDGGCVEEAEAHRCGHFGMMAGRSHRHEGVAVAAVHHAVHGMGRATDGMHQGGPGAGAHDGVAMVEGNAAVLGRGLFDRVEIARWMNPGDHLGLAPRRLVAHEGIEARVGHHLMDGAQPFRPFGMARTRIMVET